jgi:hypothetical protein
MGCPELTNPSTESEQGKVEIFTSDNGGSLISESGAEIIVPAGAVVQKTDGSTGSVSFSIEPDINQADLPIPLPNMYHLVGKIYGFGPSSFIFNEPIHIFLPASSESSPENLAIAWYNDAEKQWILLPVSSIDESKKRIGITSFELGYFAVVKIANSSKSSKNAEIQNDKRVGGIRFAPTTNDYYYTLTVKTVTYKYPEIGWSNLIGYNVGTGSYPTGGPLPKTYMSNIPQGAYTIEISRVRRGTIFSPPGERETYSNPILINVTGFSWVGGWSIENWSGWNDLTLSGGDWRIGNPATWPKPTVPFGTGQFQATLSWTNPPDGNYTDLDLHLFGPNDIHVYFANEISLDGSIMLDVDWISKPGNAVENIFSTKNMPKGQYKLYVDTFDGYVPRQFEVRVIRQGSIVKTFRSTTTKISATESDLIHVQTFNIQ